jgi:hypothetical protein
MKDKIQKKKTASVCYITFSKTYSFENSAGLIAASIFSNQSTLEQGPPSPL